MRLSLSATVGHLVVLPSAFYRPPTGGIAHSHRLPSAQPLGRVSRPSSARQRTYTFVLHFAQPSASVAADLVSISPTNIRYDTDGRVF